MILPHGSNIQWRIFGCVNSNLIHGRAEAGYSSISCGRAATCLMTDGGATYEVALTVRP